jgi:hypothetical protein
MRSGPAATVGVLLGLALILPACGDERTAAAPQDTAASTSARSTRGKSKSSDAAATRRCGRLLGDFLDSMESLNNTLAVGLSYDDYVGAVNHVRSTYASVQVDRLPIVCLGRVGGPAERALNVYIGAANTWGDCLATIHCDPEAVEPKLQRKWEEASDLLSEAKSGLRELG